MTAWLCIGGGGGGECETSETAIENSDVVCCVISHTHKTKCRHFSHDGCMSLNESRRGVIEASDVAYTPRVSD